MSPDLDSTATTIVHRERILGKRFLRKVYETWYDALLERVDLDRERVIELGAGSGFLKTIHPRVITSDITRFPYCDLTCNAEVLPFRPNSVDVLVLVNVLHHIPNCVEFFAEAERVLRPKGRVLMLEPWLTSGSKIIYKVLHHEPMNITRSWKFESRGRLTGANIALPWMVFERDREYFNRTFPQLRIEKLLKTCALSYLLSGGVGCPFSAPALLHRIASYVETHYSMVQNHLSMFCLIELRKDS